MKISEHGLQFLMREEGCVLRPYLDSVGIPTIGVGCTYYENGKKVKLSDPAITKDRALSLLNTLLEKEYVPAVQQSIKKDINDNQLTACTSLAFNIGTGGFKKSTLVKRINLGAIPDLVTEGFKMWRNAGGYPILLPRRIREAKLYFQPVALDYVFKLETPELMYDDHIKFIQKALGFGLKDQDGWYGPETERAVKDFQQYHRLNPDGIAGRETMRLLNVIMTGKWDESLVNIKKQ